MDALIVKEKKRILRESIRLAEERLARQTRSMERSDSAKRDDESTSERTAAVAAAAGEDNHARTVEQLGSTGDSVKTEAVGQNRGVADSGSVDADRAGALSGTEEEKVNTVPGTDEKNAAAMSETEVEENVGAVPGTDEEKVAAVPATEEELGRRCAGNKGGEGRT